MSESDPPRRFRIVRPGEHPSDESQAGSSARSARTTLDSIPGEFTNIFNLNGRIALISGGGGALARTIARGLADHGARLVIADVDVEAATETARHCDRPGYESVSVMLDVTNPNLAREVVEHIEQTVGRVDILVNAAGINIRRPATEYSPDEWMRIINTNLSGVFFVTQAVGRNMIARGYGRVLNLASVSSLLGHPFHAPYAASKGGIAIMTKSLATEWAPRGVTVNAIGPAYTETPLTREYLADDERRQRVLAAIPMGRLGTPDDLVGAAVYLCSDAARFVTGQTLYIDGGRTAD
ncbi:glucose 1-dehydrogenase [soil metagenome]